MSTATLAASLLAGYTDGQYRKAIALVREGRIHRDGVDYLVRSSDGMSAYLVSAYRQTCTCRAGSLGRRCYHLLTALAMDEGEKL